MSDTKIGRLTQDELAELRRTVPHATASDIGAEWKDGADPAMVEDLAAYLHHFAAPKRDADGKFIKGNPCLRCDAPLSGDLVSQIFNRAGFEWGIAHGSGFCRNCRWPATLYHFVKDRNGEDLVTFRHIVLQAHPDDIEIRERTP